MISFEQKRKIFFRINSIYESALEKLLTIEQQGLLYLLFKKLKIQVETFQKSANKKKLF